MVALAHPKRVRAVQFGVKIAGLLKKGEWILNKG